MKGDFEFNIKGNVYDEKGRELLQELLYLGQRYSFSQHVDYLHVKRWGDMPGEKEAVSDTPKEKE